jgi:hypothetical protein
MSTNDSGRAAAAAAIRGIHAAADFAKAFRPAGAPPVQRNHTAAAQRVSKALAARLDRAGMRIRPSAGLTIEDDRIGDASVEAIRKVHALGPGKLEKGIGLPPKSSNITDRGGLADTGATNDWRDETAPHEKPTRLGPAHSASIHDASPLPTQKDAQGLGASLDAIKRAHAAGPRGMWGH